MMARHAATKLLKGEVWCPECGGTGRVWVKGSGLSLAEYEEQCSGCDGTGKLDEGVDENEDS